MKAAASNLKSSIVPRTISMTFLGAMAVLATAGLANGDIIWVPDDYLSIQDV